MAAEAHTAALFTHQGYRYTVVTIATGIQGVEAELWYVPPGDDTKTPGWKYFGRRTAGIPAEARDQVERDFKAWVEGQLAWVLWAQLGTPRGIEWFVVERVPTYEACESKRVSSLVKGQHIGYVCLPDTVDPRGPKETK